MFQLSQRAASGTRTRALTHCLQLCCSSRSGLAGDSFLGNGGGVPVAEDHLRHAPCCVSQSRSLTDLARAGRIAAMVVLALGLSLSRRGFIFPLW